MKAGLDEIDWQILAELQADGRMTNVELARRVGISAPPCLRRMRNLEEQGIITGYRAMIDGQRIGYDVLAFVMVGLQSQAGPDVARFEAQARAWPMVRECHLLSGDVDFLLKCVAPDLPAFQSFIVDHVSQAPGVGSVRTSWSLRRVKDEAEIPLPDLRPS